MRGVFRACMARRSRYSIWPLKFEFECLPTQNAFRGSGTARHLGPTPRGRLKFGRMLAFRTRAARNRRVKDARRSVTGPLSAASARYLRIGDSDFGAVNTGKRDFSKWRQPIYTQTGSFSCDSPPRFPLVYSRTVQDGRYLPKVAARHYGFSYGLYGFTRLPSLLTSTLSKV
jgi:hypothetical protein